MDKHDMARVKFTADFDWHTPGTNGLETTAYKAETEATVTRACCTAAVAAGKGVEVPAPPRASAKEAQ